MERTRHLTLDEQDAIRLLSATRSRRELAVEFGVSHETVRSALRVREAAPSAAGIRALDHSQAVVLTTHPSGKRTSVLATPTVPPRMLVPRMGLVRSRMSGKSERRNRGINPSPQGGPHFVAKSSSSNCFPRYAFLSTHHSVNTLGSQR